MNHPLTRQILCTTQPTDPRDREDLWKARKRQARVEQLVDHAFPQRHPEQRHLSVPARVCAFFRGVKSA